MAKYAVIDEQGIVTNLIIADAEEIERNFSATRCVEIEDSFPLSIGDTYP
jgi:hypothetical protein